MKKILLLAASAVPALLSCCSARGQAISEAGAALPHTLLWKISGNGLVRPSYLFGTMHLLCADDARISPGLDSVIHHVDGICFEINLSDVSDMLGSMKFMQMADGKRLSDLMPDSDYHKVKDYFAKHASMLPFDLLERFKPMLVSSLIEEQNLDCQVTDGMEIQIMKAAQGLNKRMKGLETAQFQAGLFDSIPYAKQARELVNSIDSATEYKKMSRDLVTVYQKQDLGGIDSLSREGDASLDAYMDLLLYGRNRKWVDSLKTLLPENSWLIAVGAAHLAGDQGLILLLRKKGYILSPMRN
jgi:uncharacterized protein YbaP (TraB family)